MPQYPNYLNYPNNQMMPQQMPQQMPQMQSYLAPTIVNVRSEAEARNYPVGLGNSVMFKDETKPYIYTKTMGYSQLDRPIFKKYLLEEEETDGNATETPQADNVPQYALKSDLEPIMEQIQAIQEEMKKTVKQKAVKKEATSE